MRYDVDRGGPGELLCDLTDEPGEDAIDGIKVDPQGGSTSAGPAASGCSRPRARSSS